MFCPKNQSSRATIVLQSRQPKTFCDSQKQTFISCSLIVNELGSGSLKLDVAELRTEQWKKLCFLCLSSLCKWQTNIYFSSGKWQDSIEQDQPLIFFQALSHLTSTRIPLDKASQTFKPQFKANESTLHLTWSQRKVTGQSSMFLVWKIYSSHGNTCMCVAGG